MNPEITAEGVLVEVLSHPMYFLLILTHLSHDICIRTQSSLIDVIGVIFD